MTDLRGDGWGITIEQEQLDASVMSEPDPDWTFTDAAGHTHQYDSDGQVPTAEEKALPEYWCEDCCSMHTDYELLCQECSEQIYPGTRSVTTVRTIGCLKTISGWLSDSDHAAYRSILGTLSDANPPVDITLGAIRLIGVRLTEWDGEVVRFVANEAST